MEATFSPEQRELERVLVDLARDGRADARRCTSDGWVVPAGESAVLTGFGSLGIPESAGGLGGDLVDAAIAVEALARTVYPSRLLTQLATLHVAANAGLDVTPVTNGGERWTLASEEPGVSSPRAWTTRVNIDAVAGTKTLVPFGDDVDAYVVVGPTDVALVRAGELTRHHTVDFTTPTSQVTFSDAPEAIGPLGAGLLRATVLAAADLCGVARGAVFLGADYARVREQFGQPIGARQGVAFQLSEALVGVMAAWDLTVYAAWAAQSGERDAPAIVAAAKERAGRSALFAAERAIQVHGGMGITYEADPHLFLRRALFDDTWLGTGAGHRREVGRWRLQEWSNSSTLQRS